LFGFVHLRSVQVDEQYVGNRLERFGVHVLAGPLPFGYIAKFFVGVIPK